MDYFLHFFFGIIIAYFAMISPGMLNMTALKVRIESGKFESFKFSLGAAIIIFIQAGIALFFADYFVKNPAIIETLKIAGVFVFFLLAIFFYSLSRKKINPKTSSGKGNFFMKGVVMSALNMLSIPFYLAFSIFLAEKGYITIQQPYIMLFVFGVLIGALLLFFTYVHFAELIARKVSFIARNINLILSGLFVVLGIMTLVRLFT
jgi:threonine/homoserine/homoserine lactone efflux protein